MPDVLRRLLAQSPALSISTVREHRRALEAATRDLRPVDVALVGGSLSDRLGFAFAAGYGAALAAMVPSTAGALTALCATEAGGVHPRAIETTLSPASAGTLELSGRKSFATLGCDAEVLLVVARTGVAAGPDGKQRPVLALVRVPADAPGATLTPLPEMPFAPEIGHATLALDRVAVSAADVLPGDGYDDYLKPFRTIEDIHVHASVAGYLLGVAARHGWPHPFRERLLAHAQTLRALAALPPSAAETHVALAGALAVGSDLVAACEPEWRSTPDEERTRWERDRPLLRVAEKARTLRLEAAWRSFG